MNPAEQWKALGEYGAAGMYEEPERSLFYRKALGIRRYYETCQLAEYHGQTLYPSGVLPNKMEVFPHYMEGMHMNEQAVSQKDKEMARRFTSEFYQYKSSVMPEHTVAGNMYTHSMPNYERILKEGLLSYIPRIEKIEEKDMRQGLLHVLQGIQQYLSRSVRYLESVHGEQRLISALKKVPLFPADNIYEALVAWNFILYLDNCDNLGCVASGLLPYYKGEDVTEILKNLYDNLDANNGYSMSLGTDYSPLTLQCLEASKGKRRPMIELFVNENTPEEVWDKAFESVRTGSGQPAFYSDQRLLGGLKNKFPSLSQEDAKRFCGGGCTESMIAGYSNVGSLDAGVNLLLILEQTIYQTLSKSKTFEAFYDSYLAKVRQAVDQVTAQISDSQLCRAKYNPVPMRTLLIEDCIDKGTEYYNGGARYQWSIINFAGIINVIDSMLVIRDLVFGEASLSPDGLIQLLKSNDQEFLKKARSHPVSFGKDSKDANRFSNRLSKDVFSMLDHKKPAMGEGFLPASIQFMSQVEAGKGIGATPDGRTSGAPLCDSLGAIFGKDTKGPTALLKSAASLDLERALGVPVLNFNITPDFDNNALKALILGYLKLGGIQMQITCTSEETLKEAYETPELHKNLVVRVGGYSEYFYRLSDELKRMIINRTIHR